MREALASAINAFMTVSPMISIAGLGDLTDEQLNIRFQQGKTKERVIIPIGDVLKSALDSCRPEKAEGTILRNSRGAPWTGDGFRTSWGRATTRAGLDDADLRSLIDPTSNSIATGKLLRRQTLHVRMASDAPTLDQPAHVPPGHARTSMICWL